MVCGGDGSAPHNTQTRRSVKKTTRYEGNSHSPKLLTSFKLCDSHSHRTIPRHTPPHLNIAGNKTSPTYHPGLITSFEVLRNGYFQMMPSESEQIRIK